MRSKQINFFVTNEQINELADYLKNNGWLISRNKCKTANVELLNNLSENGILVLFKESHVKEIQFNYLSKPQIYQIDVSKSPVIEFWSPLTDFDEKTIRRGRFYYEPFTYSADGTEMSKPGQFIQDAETLFKWFRKQFKNANLPDYKGFFVSEKLEKLATEHSLKLITV